QVSPESPVLTQKVSTPSSGDKPCNICAVCTGKCVCNETSSSQPVSTGATKPQVSPESPVLTQKVSAPSSGDKPCNICAVCTGKCVCNETSSSQPVSTGATKPAVQDSSAVTKDSKVPCSVCRVCSSSRCVCNGKDQTKDTPEVSKDRPCTVCQVCSKSYCSCDEKKEKPIQAKITGDTAKLSSVKKDLSSKPAGERPCKDKCWGGCICLDQPPAKITGGTAKLSSVKKDLSSKPTGERPCKDKCWGGCTCLDQPPPQPVVKEPPTHASGQPEETTKPEDFSEEICWGVCICGFHKSKKTTAILLKRKQSTKKDQVVDEAEDMWPRFKDAVCSIELEEDLMASPMTYGYIKSETIMEPKKSMTSKESIIGKKSSLVSNQVKDSAKSDFSLFFFFPPDHCTFQCCSQCQCVAPSNSGENVQSSAVEKTCKNTCCDKCKCGEGRPSSASKTETKETEVAAAPGKTDEICTVCDACTEFCLCGVVQPQQIKESILAKASPCKKCSICTSDNCSCEAAVLKETTLSKHSLKAAACSVCKLCSGAGDCVCEVKGAATDTEAKLPEIVEEKITESKGETVEEARPTEDMKKTEEAPPIEVIEVTETAPVIEVIEDVQTKAETEAITDSPAEEIGPVDEAPQMVETVKEVIVGDMERPESIVPAAEETVAETREDVLPLDVVIMLTLLSCNCGSVCTCKEKPPGEGALKTMGKPTAVEIPIEIEIVSKAEEPPAAPPVQEIVPKETTSAIVQETPSEPEPEVEEKITVMEARKPLLQEATADKKSVKSVVMSVAEENEPKISEMTPVPIGAAIKGDSNIPCNICTLCPPGTCICTEEAPLPVSVIEQRTKKESVDKDAPVAAETQFPKRPSGKPCLTCQVCGNKPCECDDEDLIVLRPERLDADTVSMKSVTPEELGKKTAPQEPDAVPPMEGAPTDAVPPTEAPTDVVPPTEEAPTDAVTQMEEAPTDAVPPVEEAPTDIVPPTETPADAVPPMEEAPTDVPPMEEAPTDVPPMEEAPTDVPQMEEAPADAVPQMEEAPTDVPPMEEAPTDAVPPIEAAPADVVSPTEEASGETAALESAPIETETAPEPKSTSATAQETVATDAVLPPSHVKEGAAEKPCLSCQVCAAATCDCDDEDLVVVRPTRLDADAISLKSITPEELGKKAAAQKPDTAPQMAGDVAPKEITSTPKTVVLEETIEKETAVPEDAGPCDATAVTETPVPAETASVCSGSFRCWFSCNCRPQEPDAQGDAGPSQTIQEGTEKLPEVAEVSAEPAPSPTGEEFGIPVPEETIEKQIEVRAEETEPEDVWQTFLDAICSIELEEDLEQSPMTYGYRPQGMSFDEVVNLITGEPSPTTETIPGGVEEQTIVSPTSEKPIEKPIEISPEEMEPEDMWPKFHDAICSIELDEDLDQSPMTYGYRPQGMSFDDVVNLISGEPSPTTETIPGGVEEQAIVSPTSEKPIEISPEEMEPEDIWPKFHDAICSIELDEDLEQSPMTYGYRPQGMSFDDIVNLISGEPSPPIETIFIKEKETDEEIRREEPTSGDIEKQPISSPAVEEQITSPPLEGQPIQIAETTPIEENFDEIWPKFINDICSIELEEDLAVSPMTCGTTKPFFSDVASEVYEEAPKIDEEKVAGAFEEPEKIEERKLEEVYYSYLNI
ncbi:hypothetical protein L9F63_020607, partial [Diploptera punctata]